MKGHLEKLGVHLMVGFRGVGFEEELRHILEEFSVGGIVLFRRNIANPDQLRDLISEAQAFSRETLGRSLLVAIDQEGGPVQRLMPPFKQLPSASEQGIEGVRAVVEWQTIAAREMRELGVQINFAPVLDVVSASGSHLMAARSLGSDPQRVAELGVAWIQTLQENGLSATAKHYPGLGRAELDPHHFAPVIHWASQEAMEGDLLPFREAIRTGVHCVMTSHARYPFLDPDGPATLSEVINGKWLRGDLGFEGALFSDDMDMAAVREAYSWDEMVHRGLRSTLDFFLLCQNSQHIEPFYRALHEAVSKDFDLQQFRRASLKRVEKLFSMHERAYGKSV